MLKLSHCKNVGYSLNGSNGEGACQGAHNIFIMGIFPSIASKFELDLTTIAGAMPILA